MTQGPYISLYRIIYGDIQGLDCEIEPAIEYVKNYLSYKNHPYQFPKHIGFLFVCRCLCLCCALNLKHPNPLLPGMLRSRGPSSFSQTETDRPSVLPKLFSVWLHLHTYHTGLQVFILLAPSLSCEFPEVSDFVIFLFLGFASRKRVCAFWAHNQCVLNGCVNA